MFVDQTVYHGRAEDTNRLDQGAARYDLLDRLGRAMIASITDAADTIEACAAVEQVLGAGIARTSFSQTGSRRRFTCC